MGPMMRTWTTERLFLRGDDYFADLLSFISNATTSIDLATYIYQPGLLADRLTGHLVDASRRGVKVRLMVDAWGSPEFEKVYSHQLRAAGVRIRVYRQGPVWRGLKSINRGLHRKFAIIDNVHLWVGSLNVSDVHLEEVFHERAWKDMGVRVEGPELFYARRSFELTFSRWPRVQWPKLKPHLLLLNDSYLNSRHTRRKQIRVMRQSQKRIWISTPYFVPVGLAYRTLVGKARRGLDVRIIVPMTNDVWFMKWIALPILNRLVSNGVKVYLYQPRFSHQKVLVVDDWITVGSTNMNHRSFMHDLEIDVVVTHKENKQRIVDSLLVDQDQSLIFDSRSYFRLPLWQKAIGIVFSWFSYWF